MNSRVGIMSFSCVLLCVFARALVADDKPLPSELIGPDIVRRAVSERAADLAASTRARERQGINRLVQDVQRVVHLPADRLKLLNVAAAGMVESAFDEVESRMQQDLQRLAQNASAKTVASTLKTSGLPYQYRRGDRNQRWMSSMRRILEADEFVRWKDVVDSRNAYRAHALAKVVAMMVQPRAKVTDEVMAKLLPLLERSVRDYLPDLSEWSGDEIYHEYLPMFILGIPEAEAKKMVPKDKWEDWHRSAGEGLDMWENIKNMHSSRLKSEKGEGKP
jgi:hypothetical protein